ncbi:ATP-binding cassette domain-containing protein [Paeniglutamicibacter sp. ZC-3]|uniref:ABC transporter ATP-binding protein n=1 Tax=Paeniglutamicibacter sp. ZC-3 TaxID=2986919 RepID=UPI0021F700A3|nr:ATP-binding cassette domain-containing protein [Paeniglutamicibacter sp. ZC-3]MCV9993032.1 ATP-binding cassette domain-containing protein [Paeniglutamicibacter sp. ZC-3]
MTARLRALDLVHGYPGRWPRSRQGHRALRGINLGIEAGQAVGLVGSSGSGKSTLVRCLLALEKVDSGSVQFNDNPLVPGPVSSLRWYRRLVQYVPQNPAGSLDPRMSVQQLMLEPLRQLRIQGEHRQMIRRALERVELDPGLLGRKPAELSGGQNQRVAIARALVPGPSILLADEPVSGLDLPLRDAVLGLLEKLVRQDGMGLLFVSHDLSAVSRLCSRTVVLESGRIVEEGDTLDMFHTARHPATRELLAAIPQLGTRTGAA